MVIKPTATMAIVSPLLLIVSLLLLSCNTRLLCSAVGIDFLYPSGHGVDIELDKGFEVSSKAVPLNVPITFYGETYNSIYINTNGLLSFETDIPNFINIQFPLDYAVIAPFYSNVDTRNSGLVSYRETNDTGILYRYNINIKNLFKHISFEAVSVFIATWRDVGYYSNGNDKVNTFQVAIASNGNDSFIQFIYPENGIEWIQGQTSDSGLPDARAQAGLISHDGRMLVLKGSGTDQIINIDKLSNTNLPGVWMFRVGNLDSDQQIEEPTVEEGNEIEGSKATETCNTGYTQCHSKAHCVDLINGFCCVCNEGYFGNGKTCLKNDVPIRVIGKVSGKINGQILNQLDLHSYIVMPDGRAYTAISKVPPTIGFSMPSLNIIGSIISWVVAKRTGGVKNGYELTGGKFNHTAILTFPNTGDHITIHNNYHGLDVFDQLRLDTDITGTIPEIPSDVLASISIILEEFTITSKGVIQSQSEQTLKLNRDSQKIPYRVQQTIKYEGCKYEEPSNITTFKMKTSKIFIKYENTEKIMRYGTSSKLVPLTEEDPCLYGSTTCVENSYCIVERDSFRCVCHPGYQEIYGPNENVLCVDLNECTAGTHYCDKNARCINEEGSFTCTCNPGFIGDGRSCKSEETSDIENEDDDCENRCDANATCVIGNSESYCECNDGFYGDGEECIPEDTEQDCRTSNCSQYAECVEVSDDVYNCACLQGFTGNGFTCYPINQRTTPIPATSSVQPTETSIKKYAKHCENGQCWCPQGYLEQTDYCTVDPNYKEDTKLDGQCNTLNNCHPQAQCVLSSFTGEYNCKCNVDYEGDGYDCLKIEGASCREARNCGENAECIYSPEQGVDVCVCNDGYIGDGYTCYRQEDECTSVNDCGLNAVCQYSQQSLKYECICHSGFNKDQSGLCQPRADYCGGGTCLPEAECKYDNDYKVYYCQCKDGLFGDGITECKPLKSDCKLLNDCDEHAACEFDENNNVHICQCDFGYFGDGYTCQSEPTCEVEPHICDRAARCIPGPENKYVCQCSEGYIGNGSYCKVAPKLESGFLLASQEIAIFRIPFNVNKQNPGKTINIRANQFAIAIDIDCPEGRVYWSDLGEKKIKSAAYNGSDYKEFLNAGVESAEGLSIDWVSRNIFWVDARNRTVEVANLETKLRKILFWQNVVNPRGITVHPYRGKIFWSDWNRQAPKIESANMDGTERTKFLYDEHVVLPNSLAIDWLTDRLCYADAGTKKIECIDLDARARQTIVADCKYPFGLAITATHFYWTDWQTLKIESIDRTTLTERNSADVPLGGFSKLYGIVAVPNKCPALSNVCQYNNGNCSPGHLCLPNGKGGRTCICAAPDLCNDI